MAVRKSIKMVEVARLQLDSKNPRLGRHFNNRKPSQDEILKEMKDWTLDELAVSFTESGFWPQEALVIVEEDGQLIVLEGNRRLAALKLLHEAAQGNLSSPKWTEIANSTTEEQIKKLSSVPCMKVEERRDVQGYLGFRHVTGIKQWAPAEKASFISYLIDKENLSYRDVMRRIGSKTPTIRQHYFAYRLLIQIENEVSDISIEDVEERFSVMYLSLRSEGTRKYLNIDFSAEPKRHFQPVPSTRLQALGNYCLWLFGTKEREPLFRDSRQTDTFGEILGSEEAVTYLEQAKPPNFEVAARKARSEEAAVVEHIERAIYEVEQALSLAHLYGDSQRLRTAVERLNSGTTRLVELFPDLRRGDNSEFIS